MLKLFKLSNDPDELRYDVGQSKKFTRFDHSRVHKPTAVEATETSRHSKPDQNENFTRFEHRRVREPAARDTPAPSQSNRLAVAINEECPSQSMTHLYSDEPIPLTTLRNALPKRFADIDSSCPERDLDAE